MNRIVLMGAAFGALLLAACSDEATEGTAMDGAEIDTAAAPEAGDADAAADCGRDCLTGLLDQYLAALDSGDASALPTADGLRFTEDQTEMAFGAEGVWASEVDLTDYRFDIVDVREGIAATLVKIEENGTPVLMAARLLTEDGEITGVESMVVRNADEGMLYNIDALDTLTEAMAETPPAGSLDSREMMIEIAERYPRGLQVGSFVTSDVPFAEDAYRFENGMYMAGPGCDFLPGCDNIKEQTLPTLAGITWHISAVDEEQGVVLVRMDFGAGSIMPRPGRDASGTLSVFEAFKVYGGEVHAVEAFMEIKPADQPLGWE